MGNRLEDGAGGGGGAITGTSATVRRGARVVLVLDLAMESPVRVEKLKIIQGTGKQSGQKMPAINQVGGDDAAGDQAGHPRSAQSGGGLGLHPESFRRGRQGVSQDAGGPY